MPTVSRDRGSISAIKRFFGAVNRHPYLVLIVVGVVIFLFVPNSESPQPVQDDRPAPLAANTNAERALNEFSRGAVSAEQEDWVSALAYYDKAIQLDPTLAAAYNNRGLAYQELGERVKAAADLSRARQLGYEPDNE